MPPATTNEAKARRVTFGQHLSDALAVRKKTQTELGAAVGVAQPSVSDWTKGASEPTADMVFDVERALDLAPGTLSKHLGYLPTSAVKTSRTFDEVVTEDPLLHEIAKRGLIAMYRELTGGDAPRAKGRARRTS